MTAKDTERLAKVEQKVDDARDDIAEVKSDVKTILGSIQAMNTNFNTKLNNLDSRFITRLEGRAVYIFLGICLAILTVYVSMK